MRTHVTIIATAAAAAVFAAFVQTPAPAAAQTSTPPVQEFALTDTTGLVAKGVTAEAAEFLGRKAIRLVKPAQGEGFALLPGTDFQDGTIEADVAVKIMTPPGVRMPGFIGLAFRAKPDASSYELFYIRPGNAVAQDQVMRNHAAQYCASPKFGWYELRRAWPWVYEAHADLTLDAWTHMKIEVAGRVSKLYLNGATQPTLIVDGMKGESLRGGVLLFGFQGEEAYFSNVKITNATPQPVKNGSDAAGAWQVKLSTDAGVFDGTLQLQREGTALTGTWSGDLGKTLPVTGTWRDGYVELSFTGEWAKQSPTDTSGPVLTRLAGWIDGDAGKGRSSLEKRADGLWAATKTALASAAQARRADKLSPSTRAVGRAQR
jgi:hypothetical protein